MVLMTILPGNKTSLRNRLHLQDLNPYEKVSYLEGKSPVEVWNLSDISYITEQTQLYGRYVSFFVL